MYIDIIDVGCGNIGSIQNWIENANVSTRIISNVRDLRSEVIVLPGVGAAGFYLDALRINHFDEAIQEHVARGRRLIGICLGFQAMSDYSEEDNGHRGLGLISGKVEKLAGIYSHNQWKPFVLRKDRLGTHDFSSVAGLSKKRVIEGRVFFNHEYGFVVDDKCAFSQPIGGSLSKYSAMVLKDRIIGMQFHPEKSQATGLDILKMIL